MKLETSTKKINYPTSKFLDRNQTTSLNSGIYFIGKYGGEVFKLNKNEFIRIDRSFTHKMQMGSSLVVHNDTIFKYGGYGFWSMRNFFTYYNDLTSEWEIVSPSGSESLPKGSRDSTIKTNKGDFYVYGGITLNEFNPLEYVINDEVPKI